MNVFLVSLRKMCSDYHKRVCELEDAKYDLEYSVAIKDLEASTLFTFSSVLFTNLSNLANNIDVLMLL